MTSAFRSQYLASINMLSACIEQCPDEAWDDVRDTNRFWHLAYHALFYTALYLSPNEENATLWQGCRAFHQLLGKSDWAPDFDPAQATVYSKEELLDFIHWLRERVVTCLDDVSAEAPSGFGWIPFSRFELHIYNLRHLQHHVGQLSERIRQLTGDGIAWVGKAGE